MRTTPLLLILLALTACRSDQVGPVAIEQVVDGAPVRVVEARGQLSTLLGLGSTATSISSRDDKNAAAAIFDVRVEGSVPEGAEMASISTCRVGEWTIAQPLTWNGGLEGVAVGETKQFYAQYMPSAAAPHVPTACEFSSWYGALGMRKGAVRIEPTRLATVCWTPDAIVEGACAADVLPREPDSDGEPVAIPVVHAAITKASKGGHSVSFQYLVARNDSSASAARIIGRMKCDAGGELVEGSANTLTMFDHLAPGEAVAGHGSAFGDRPLAAPPDHCTLDLRLSMAPGDEGTSIATWCLRADRVEPGGCD